MVDCTTKRIPRNPGRQQRATAQPGGVTSGQQPSFQQRFKQESGPASRANGKGAQQDSRLFTPTRAMFLSNKSTLGLHGDPHARIEPVTKKFKPEAEVVKARGRVYSPIKTAWLATCIGTLVALGLVFCNLHAV